LQKEIILGCVLVETHTLQASTDRESDALTSVPRRLAFNLSTLRSSMNCCFAIDLY